MHTWIKKSVILNKYFSFFLQKMLSDTLLQKDYNSSTPSEAGTFGSTFERVELNECFEKEAEDQEVTSFWQVVCMSVFGTCVIGAIIVLGICNGLTCTK